MKNILMITMLLGGFCLSVAQAQTCVTPCPPQCCIASCCPVKGSAAQVAIVPGENGSTAACTPEQLAACKLVCTPAQIAACQAGQKDSKREVKEWQKMNNAQVKAGCMPSVCTPPKSELHIDQTYHQTPKPVKS